MVNRWIGIATLSLMLVANTALVVRDVLPGWLAGDPPQAEIEILRPGQQRRAQVSIYNEIGKRVGRSWTLVRRSSTLLAVDTWTVLYPIPLPQDTVSPRLLIHSNVKYMEGAGVDGLEFEMRGLGIPVKLRGERVPPNDFPCQWQFGERRGQFVLNGDALRALGDAVRPFDRLPGLYVGQAWRVELFNLLTQLAPGWKNGAMGTTSVLVRVTGVEPVEHAGRVVEAFRVEADKVVAWAAPDGRVLRQEVELPLLGRLTLIDEPFDEVTFRRAIRLPPAGG